MKQLTEEERKATKYKMPGRDDDYRYIVSIHGYRFFRIVPDQNDFYGNRMVVLDKDGKEWNSNESQITLESLLIDYLIEENEIEWIDVMMAYTDQISVIEKL